MTGTQWYSDLKPPFAADDFPTITLSTTSLMLFPSALWAPTYATDWFAGKRMKLELWGKATTVATPGNLTIEIRYGTTDNGGTILATSAAVAMGASKSNITWRMEVDIRCRDINATTGANGSLSAAGVFIPDQVAVLLPAANVPQLIPATAPMAGTAVDLTTTSGINVQWKRSGSSAETVTVTDLVFQHLN